MPACSRYLNSSPGDELTFDFRKIGQILGPCSPVAPLSRTRQFFALEQIYRVSQRFHGVNIYLLNKGRFTEISFGHHNGFQATDFCLGCNTQGSARRSHVSIQSQFSEEKHFFESVAQPIVFFSASRSR
jgi:hypothetical protein